MKLSLVLPFVAAAQLFLLPGGVASAQTEAIPDAIPAAPHLQEPSGFARWTVRYGNPKRRVTAEAAGKKRRGTIKQVQVIRTAPTRVVVVHYGDGRRDELWSHEHYFVENSSVTGLSIVRPTPGGDNTLLGGYLHSDFPEFRWVSKETFLKTMELEGRLCHVYREKVQAASDADSPGGTDSPEAEPATAWIDAKSRIPVRWERGAEVAIVVMEAPPSGAVTLPPNVLQLVAQMQRLMLINSLKAPRGG